jgi:hypothetical protein
MELGLMSIWIDIEKDLRRLATIALGISEEDARGYPMGELLRLLHRVNVIDETILARTREMLNIRNGIVHSGDPILNPSDALIRMDDLARRIKTLVQETLIDEHLIESDPADERVSGFIPYTVRRDPGE